MLQVDALTTRFESREGAAVAVDGISYAVGPGETLGVVGESGCAGKSVTALSIMRPGPGPGRGRSSAAGSCCSRTAISWR